MFGQDDKEQPVSEELACGKITNETAVRSQEVIFQQIFELYPLQLVEDFVFELALECVDCVELQVYCPPMTVVVANMGDARPNNGSDAQLLVELAAERLFRTFAGLNFSPGKFPLEGHWLVGPSLANQHFAVANEKPCHDEPKSWSDRARIGTRLRVFHATSVNALE